MKKIMCALLVCVLVVGFLPVNVQAADFLTVGINLEGVDGNARNVELGVYYRDTRITVFYNELVLSVFTSPQGTASFFVDHSTADIDNLRLAVLSGVAAGASIPFSDFQNRGNGDLLLSAHISDLTPGQPVVPPTVVVEPTTPVVPGGTRTLRFAIGNVNFTDNGEGQELEAAPFIEDGRTHVPLRIVVEALGSQDVAFNDGVITFSVDGQNFTMTIGQELPGAMGTPVLHSGRTFVPLRFIIEAVGAEVRWDGDNQAVYVYID